MGALNDGRGSAFSEREMGWNGAQTEGEVLELLSGVEFFIIMTV